MKKLLSIALALLITGALNFLPVAHAQEVVAATASATTKAQEETPTPAQALTNQDILEMTKSGLSPEIIVAKIKAAGGKFDTSPATLQELKTAGVADVVILAMVQGPAAPAVAGTGAATAAGQPVEMVTVNVPDGTPVEVELVATASGQDLKVGDIVDFRVLQPVQVNGVVVVEKDAPAKARITKVKKAGHWGRAGKLDWAMQDAVGIDGSRIPLRFTKGTAGDSKGGTVAVGAVATTVLLGPIGLLWGLKKGKPAIIPAGNRYSVFVSGNIAVKGKAAAHSVASQTGAQQ